MGQRQLITVGGQSIGSKAAAVTHNPGYRAVFTPYKPNEANTDHTCVVSGSVVYSLAIGKEAAVTRESGEAVACSLARWLALIKLIGKALNKRG